MFIVCGVLYAIDSVTERNTKIHLALDLYRGVVLDDVNLPFTNPFKNTTMALYNPETKVGSIAFFSLFVIVVVVIIAAADAAVFLLKSSPDWDRFCTYAENKRKELTFLVTAITNHKLNFRGRGSMAETIRECTVPLDCLPFQSRKIFPIILSFQRICLLMNGKVQLAGKLWSSTICLPFSVQWFSFISAFWLAVTLLEFELTSICFVFVHVCTIGTLYMGSW